MTVDDATRRLFARRWGSVPMTRRPVYAFPPRASQGRRPGSWSWRALSRTSAPGR